MAVTVRDLGVLLSQAGFGSSQLFGSAAACLGSAVLVSRSCPCEPGAVVRLPLLHLLLDAAKAAPVRAAVAPEYPIDHSAPLLHVPWAAPGLAVARLKTRTAVQAAVAALLGRVAAIAETGDPSRYSMRGALGKCVNLLLCRRRSRQRAAAGADWCSVT